MQHSFPWEMQLELHDAEFLCWVVWMGWDVWFLKPSGPLREIVCEICRAVDALQTEESSMAERHKRQRESLS